MARGTSDIPCLITFRSKENDGCGYVDVNVVNEPENLTKIQDYLSRLSAPKLSVHVGEHVGGTNTR